LKLNYCMVHFKEERSNKSERRRNWKFLIMYQNNHILNVCPFTQNTLYIYIELTLHVRLAIPISKTIIWNQDYEKRKPPWNSRGIQARIHPQLPGPELEYIPKPSPRGESSLEYIFKPQARWGI
jgi:hypothetical protein